MCVCVFVSVGLACMHARQGMSGCGLNFVNKENYIGFYVCYKS